MQRRTPRPSCTRRLALVRGLPGTIAACSLALGCRTGYDPVPFSDDGGSDADASVTDAAPPDGSVADAGQVDASCDPAAPLTDDFSSQDPRWDPFADDGVAPAIVGGRLRVTLSPSSVVAPYGGFVTSGAYDLVGRDLSVEVPSMVSTLGHSQALWQLKNGTSELGFEQQHGELRMFSTGAPTGSVPYDPVQQRYWQVRESSGTVFFETSPDAVAWTLQFSTASTFDLSHLRIALDAGRYQQETELGFVEFDHLGGTVSLGTACKRGLTGTR